MWIVTALALLYSAAHFVRSGILQPFDHPNLGKFDEQAWPLRSHLATGAPVHTTNPAQYGPVFFFVMDPLLRANLGDDALAAWLYAIQIVCIVGSFLLTIATLKPWIEETHADDWPLAVVWLAILWLNFSPFYTILAQKSVETWELLLISLALFAHVRGQRWIAAFAMASATLIKALPAAFLYYWLFTERRTFAYACAMLAALLAVSHLLYGPEMGLWYLPGVVAHAAGDSYGLTWHENVSLKAAVAKLFGTLPSPTRDAAQTSGYFVELAGWRRSAATLIGDALIVAGVAALTWTWQRRRDRPRGVVLQEWSVLAIAVLILSPNTIFEYTTIALGAISYAFVKVAVIERDRPSGWLLFITSLLLVGGLLPRQWLNRVTMIDVVNRWAGHAHLTASEAYQYYCVPLIGLALLLVVLLIHSSVKTYRYGAAELS